MTLSCWNRRTLGRLFFFYTVFCLVLYVNATNPQKKSVLVVKWQQQEEEGAAAEEKNVRKNEIETETNRKPSRRLFALSNPLSNPPYPHSSDAPACKPPHKLRTNLWQVDVQWKGVYRKNNNKNLWQLEFADNGFVREIPSNSSSTIRDDVDNTTTSHWMNLGKWSSSVKGVQFHLNNPSIKERFEEQEDFDKDDDDDDDDEQDRLTFAPLEFHGQLLLNPFGPQPKLIRGVILEGPHDDKNHFWFRRVVGTFSAQGIGQDTADLAYQNRR